MDGSLDFILSKMFPFLIIIEEKDMILFLRYGITTYKYNNYYNKFILPRNTK